MPSSAALNFPTEAHAVEASLSAWHRALEAHDWAMVDSGLTPSFLMIEHDKVLDKAALMEMLAVSARTGRQRATLRDFRTKVEGNCAWTTLRNDELWIPNRGDTRSFSFLETAVLRYLDGYWQIERYHATRLVLEAVR